MKEEILGKVIEDLQYYIFDYLLHPETCAINDIHPDENQEFECSCGLDKKLEDILAPIKTTKYKVE